MRATDESDTRAFWDYVQRTTGVRRAPWDTFVSIFMTHLQQKFPIEVASAPVNLPIERVLRYAFDRGDPRRAAEGEDVQPYHLSRFLTRFGPMSRCLAKASRSLFDEAGCLEPWFHGSMSREEATRAINDWGVSHRSIGRPSRRPAPPVGAFLFRYSDRQASIAFSYRLSATEVKHCLIENNGREGYVLAEVDQVWSDLRAFVSEQRHTFVYPVTSDLHRECKDEIFRLKRSTPRPDTPQEHERNPYILFGKAQLLACTPDGPGVDIVGVLHEALSLAELVVSIVKATTPRDIQLEAKALRLQADILWKRRRRAEGVRRFRECLEVVKEAQEAQEVSHDGSPVVSSGIPRHVHEVLAIHYLESRLFEPALHHFSECVACTTDEEDRGKLLRDFQAMAEFREATADLTHTSVEEMLEEGIKYFSRNEFNPAGRKLERALRDARCIGERTLESRALGNVATIDYKTKRFREAIPRYRMCVQLLRQLRDHVTERKILNYLVICCIEAKRWTPAKRFHEQLSQLAVSEDNISLLRRLESRIENGVEAEESERRRRRHFDAAGSRGASGSYARGYRP